MTETHNEQPQTNDPVAGRRNENHDHVSDPALNTESGHDWSDEGGATENGPATGTEPAPEK